MAQDRKITPEKRGLIHLSFYSIEVYGVNDSVFATLEWDDWKH